MHPSPKYTLNNGVDIDVLGYGVYKVPAEDCADLVSTAFDTGYRTIDTAALYGNEAGVGAAVNRAVAGGLAREEMFVTSKVWNTEQGNFEASHLHQLLDACDVIPALNQVELHPWLAQTELRQLHAELGIATQAWSPLARGAIFEDPTLQAVAAEKGRSVAQIVLRWHVQSGHLVIPKASSARRMQENLDVFSFDLDEAEMARVNALNQDRRSGSHPNQVN